MNMVSRLIKHSPGYAWAGGLAFLLGMTVMYGCSKEDASGDSDSRTAVVFNAGIQTTVPGAVKADALRTRTSGNGSSWAQGDAVGIFMVKAGGTLPGEIISGTDNVKYTVKDATAGTLTAANGAGIYYPQSGGVDFIAYYPYRESPANDPYRYSIWVTGQTSEAVQNAQDILYSNNAKNKMQSADAVDLEFRHVMSKVKLNLKLGDGLTAFTGSDITAVIFAGMPGSAMLDLQNGTLTDGEKETFPAFKSATVSVNAVATFTAIVVPQESNIYSGRTAVFTVDGADYVWTIPDAASFKAGNLYTYPVTIRKTGVEVGLPAISDWITNTHASGIGIEVGKGIEKVRVPAGTFLMGSSDGNNTGNTDGSGLNTIRKEPNRYTDETQHEVTLSRDFYMSRYEITNAQYAGFLNAVGVGSDGNYETALNGQQKLIYSYRWGVEWDDATSLWQPVSGYDDFPVVNVTWYGADEFARWVGGALPTEAQWEYACRGGKTDSLPFGIGDGDKLYGDMANINGGYPYELPDGQINNYDGSVSHPNTYLGYTVAVGSYSYPNGYGLYDMHGNVLEWCSDWYGDYGTASVTDPTGPATGSVRVLRGGSWSFSARYCRSAFRSYFSPGDRDYGVGFRVVFP